MSSSVLCFSLKVSPFTYSDLISEDLIPHSWFPYKSKFLLASRKWKRLNFTLLSKNKKKQKKKHQYSLSRPWELWTTYSDLHTHTNTCLFEPISTNPVDMMQGELENRCSWSDLQKPFNSFPLLDFPFYPFKSTYNRTQGCCKWPGLPAWVGREGSSKSQRSVVGGFSPGRRRNHLHFSLSDPM